MARKVPYELVAHGHTRIDNYYWMRDESRSNPEVLAHLNAENAHTRRRLEPLTPLRDKLLIEMTGRLERDFNSVPFLSNGYYYYRRYRGDDEYPIHVRKKVSLDAPEEVLLDGNRLAAGHAYSSIGGYAVSSSNRLLAYAHDTA